MGLLALGVSHRTAPLELREQLAFGAERLPAVLAELQPLAGGEFALLSTCNRTELYCTAGADEARALLEFLARRQHIDADRLRAAHYLLEGEDALRHMMRVASGLDSLVLGEPQILGQMKDAYALAHRAGTVGRELERCFQQVFAVAKRVRTETAIGANPVSVAFAAVSLARHLFADLAGTHALLIGAGEMIELVARHLADNGVKSLTVANRTLARAHVLADRHGGRAVTMEEVPWALEQADMVISCTAAQVPILGKGTVERALRKRRHRPLFMVDLAVPRDIEPEVAQLEDVFLYSVDDLQGVVDGNVRAREEAARAAEVLVQSGSAQFLQQQREQGAGETLRAVRNHVEQLRERELLRAQAEIARGADPAEVMARMSRQLVNKLLHAPSLALRRSAAEQREDQLAYARRLFGVDDDVDAADQAAGRDDTL